MFGSLEDSGQLRLRTPARDEEIGDPLSRLLEQTDALTDGCQEEQRQAYDLLKNEKDVVSHGQHMIVYVYCICLFFNQSNYINSFKGMEWFIVHRRYVIALTTCKPF